MVGAQVAVTHSESATLEPAVAPLDPVVLQLKWKHQFQFAGYYAAQQQGFYRDVGLEVTIVEAPGGNIEPAQRVLQGRADFGVAASDLLLMRSQGEPVVALAAIFQHSPLVFLTLPGSGVDSVHHLTQGPVMLEAHAAELLAYLQYEGISPAAMTFVPHTFNPLDLINGRVIAMSAYSTDEPFVVQQAGKPYAIFTPRAAGIDFYGDTLFTTEQQIRDHPERVQRFLEASLRGWAYALDHPEAMVEVIYTQYSRRHSREHLVFEAEKTRSLILPDVVEIGYMNAGRWRHIADTYASLHMAPPHFALDGFLYDRNPRPDLTWLYLGLAGTTGVLTLMALVSTRFYRLNRAIRREMIEKERVAAELAAFERRYRILVENAPFAILITRHSDGRLIYLNPRAADSFEVAQDHAVGRFTRQYYVHPENYDRLLRGLDSQGYMQNFEVQLKSAPGRMFWASLSASLTQFGHEPAIFVALVDVTDRKGLETQLERMAMTDELTGLFNRRYFTQQGLEELRQAQITETSLAVLLIDVDRFKMINDTYGHDTGDVVLQTVASIMAQNLRQTDTLGRWGGEEFAVLLPNTTEQWAVTLAERLRQAVQGAPHHTSDQPIGVTISIGVTTRLPADGASLDTLLSQADQAMYQAKHRGRNQVVVYSGTTLASPPGPSATGSRLPQD